MTMQEVGTKGRDAVGSASLDFLEGDPGRNKHDTGTLSLLGFS